MWRWHGNRGSRGARRSRFAGHGNPGSSGRGKSRLAGHGNRGSLGTETEVRRRRHGNRDADDLGFLKKTKKKNFEILYSPNYFFLNPSRAQIALMGGKGYWAGSVRIFFF